MTTCIYKRLPAGGQPDILPDAGDLTTGGSSSCFTGSKLIDLQKAQGRFRNVFVGQVITFSLNLRLPQLNEDTDALDPNLALEGRALCRCFRVWPVGGTTWKDFCIPDSVWNALPPPTYNDKDQRIGPTFGDLRMLANRALANETEPAKLIGDLNNVITAINEGLDECKNYTCLE